MKKLVTADVERLIVENLSDELRRPPWRGSPNELAGHCYVASEALYHLTGKRMRPHFVKHEGAPHWYLVDEWGAVVDLTAGQFATPVPYHEGRGKGFLTSLPSRRAQVVIDRVTA